MWIFLKIYEYDIHNNIKIRKKFQRNFSYFQYLKILHFYILICNKKIWRKLEKKHFSHKYDQKKSEI